MRRYAKDSSPDAAKKKDTTDSTSTKDKGVATDTKDLAKDTLRDKVEGNSDASPSSPSKKTDSSPDAAKVGLYAQTIAESSQVQTS